MDGYVTIGTKLETAGFDKEMQDLISRLNDGEKQGLQMANALNEIMKQYGELTGDRLEFYFESDVQQAHALQQQMIAMSNTIEKLTGEKIHIKGITDVEQQAEKTNNSLKKVDSGLTKIVKKVGKWALAVFGVRTAYRAVQSAINMVAGYDDQIKTDLEYIRFAIATALKPVIEWIIKAVYTLLSLLGMALKRLFGIDIFANATKKAFKDTNKEAKKLRKELAGFDEANVLGDNVGGAGGGTPTINFKNEVDVEGIVNKVRELRKKINDMIGEFFDKLRPKITGFLTDKGFPKLAIEGVNNILLGIENVLKGLPQIVEGIILTILGLITGNKQLFLDGVESIVLGIERIALGILQIVKGIIQTILGLSTGFYGKFRQSFQSFIQNLGIFALSSVVNKAKEIYTKIKGTARDIVTAIKQLLNGDLVGALNSFKSAFKNFSDSLKSLIKAPVNVLIDAINYLITKISTIELKIPDWVPDVGGRRFGFSLNVPKIPRLAKGGIINMPGRGVAIGGESAREGVIPLTDSQQMALLGEAIGKYITINASITNTMNGRVISRELQKINNKNDFAFNR